MTIPSNIHPESIESLLNGDHGDPFSLLGPHPAGEGRISFRAFRPTAQSLRLVLATDPDTAHEMVRLRDEGFFELVLPVPWPVPAYHFVETTLDGATHTVHDPYAFPSLFGETDVYLLREGRHWQSYEKMGAHLAEINGVRGVHFAVWAPSAYCVSVIGAFNNWDTRVHPMRFLHEPGVWELFVPGVEEWALYKYDVRTRSMGYRAEKTDPYGYYAEQRPRTASIVVNLDTYEWHDGDWMTARASRDPLPQPMNIYEVHLGSWRRKNKGLEWLTYRELADELIAYVTEMGYTHIELMPIAEHPLDMSWGYQITGYYAVTSRYGTPQDFMYFVDRCHQAGIGVILDWVPAHFPKDGHALSYFDGTHLYEHMDARKGEHPDWGTYIFNYGRNEVRNFLISNALFWLKKYHIDGLRVDAVSSMLYLDFGRKDGEWIPNEYGGNENLEAIEFMRQTNIVVHQEAPGAVTIAEESTAYPMVSRPAYLGGLGFTLKWNMGWMHDTLRYIQKDPVYRRWHHNDLTFSLMYAFSENFVLSLSHDEVVHGKGSLIGKAAGDWWQKFATLRALHGYQITHPGKKLMFMGGEFGQFREWSEARSLDWELVENYPTHRGLQQWVRDLNHFYLNEPALWEVDFDAAGFAWVEANDADNSTYSYMRFAADRANFVVVALSFTPVVRDVYRVGVPEPGYYREVLNSDSELYGGGNVGNGGGVMAEDVPWNNYPYSLPVTLPPLGFVLFKLQREG